jgi:hypothetical protein
MIILYFSDHQSGYYHKGGEEERGAFTTIL